MLPAYAVTGTVGRKIIGKGGEKITFFSKKNAFFSLWPFRGKNQAFLTNLSADIYPHQTPKRIKMLSRAIHMSHDDSTNTSLLQAATGNQLNQQL
ncbi:hypothetical protein MD588_16780 [Photobacterium sp. SDRW27]|uniref:hypothetical protein n=1 Tax=Photobacterium obscurum TaxID=2829490 RepID=UPI00224387E4|nr:hypothetical protein [Photobacterium obscurum]MCW8330464.1 hypothetical protein [Photobacterium obscurum]